MFKLRKMNFSDLEKVLRWRNHPEVRKNMYTSHEISMSEHEAWFFRVQGDPSRQALICEDENQVPVGFVGFTEIKHEHQTASWAYYSGDLKRKGVGTQMEYQALNYAFDELGLEKLNCEVLDFNTPVIDFHRKFGFQIEGVFRKHHVTNGERCDVYRFAIFKKDWTNFQRQFFTDKLNGSLKKNKFEIGQTYEKSFVISSSQLREFADLIGDRNPIHLDDEVAQKLGFEKRILHGFLSASIFSQVFGMEFPGHGTVYVSQTLDFHGPAYPDKKLVAKFKIVSLIGRKIFVATKIIDEDDKLLISGEAKLFLPA